MSGTLLADIMGETVPRIRDSVKDSLGQERSTGPAEWAGEMSSDIQVGGELLRLRGSQCSSSRGGLKHGQGDKSGEDGFVSSFLDILKGSRVIGATRRRV